MGGMEESDRPDILIESDPVAPAIRHLRLNRPSARNAMSARLVQDCIDWFEAARHDPSIGAVILSGAGKGFCAGSDLAGLAAMDDMERSAFEEASGRLARMIPAFPRPVIAAVHGFAIGGGLTLAAACDIVITAPDARWSLPEVPIGLFPAWGLDAVEQRVGRPAARRLSWGIDSLDGQAAAAMGLADQVAQDVAGEATALARRLAALPRAQVAAVKDYFAAHRIGAAADQAANALFMAACATDTAQASFARFGAKSETGGL
ncbi:enoyl-CoA hydratase/isomerase family protein [Sphingobium sp. AN558]|uniref:enoyl-CoA hydratase/isomerase family protein n=1 Tax=Sphingobium sp. AN558 TaxID=3133442 RepID=UPI0030BAB08D